MTRVALVDPSAYTPAYDHALAHALAVAGARVDLFTSRFAYGEVPAPDGYASHPLFYRRARGAPGSRLRRVSKLASHARDMDALRRITRAHADIVHLQWLAVPWLDATRLPDRPRVLTAHDLLPREPRPGQVWLQRRLLRAMDAIVVHSQYGRARIVDGVGIDPDRVHVIHHGAFEHVARAGAGRLPDELRDSGEPVVLFFGLLRPYKGVQTLLDAWRGITGAQLWIVGRPMVDVAALRAQAPPGVQFVTRYVAEDEVAGLLRRADLGVLPYVRTERFDQSGVLASALACGLATILSDIGGFSEVAATGSARLVSAGDAGALHEALAELLRDPAARERMSAAARAAAAGPYSWSVAAQRTLELYRSLTGAPLGSALVMMRRTGLDDPDVRTLLTELPWGVGDLTAPEFAAPDGTMIVATRGGELLGCIGVRRLRDGVGEVKRLYVREAARRGGVARALLAEAESAARDLGDSELWLDTHADEPAALFASVGYEPIPAYNDHHYARHWFAKRL